MTSAQPNSATSGRAKCKSPGMARENSPRPDHWPRPTKMSVPTPAASRPGRSTSSSIVPPKPTASISRKAPVRGEPSSVLIAAKLPAAPTTVLTCGADAALARLTAQAARPPPRATSGASGPRTAPNESVASAASAMPGSSFAANTPLALKPSAGECPPVPGKYWIVRATRMPPTASIGNGHQTGTEWKPRSSGRLVNTQCWSLLTSARKPQATADTGTPSTPATTSRRT